VWTVVATARLCISCIPEESKSILSGESLDIDLIPLYLKCFNIEMEFTFEDIITMILKYAIIKFIS
jgi:hypothetical protein